MTPKYPKGYPVEHLIGQCCPDGINSVAEGVTKTLEAIARDYQIYADLRIVPDLRDHGVITHNVFKRVSATDFAEFHSQVCAAAVIAREALEAAKRALKEAEKRFDRECTPESTGALIREIKAHERRVADARSAVNRLDERARH